MAGDEERPHVESGKMRAISRLQRRGERVYQAHGGCGLGRVVLNLGSPSLRFQAFCQPPRVSMLLDEMGLDDTAIGWPRGKGTDR